MEDMEGDMEGDMAGLEALTADTEVHMAVV
jgi:hypothetical protein